MSKLLFLLLSIGIFLGCFSFSLFALNPFITHIYTADPSAHVFENRVYVYPSHDKDNSGWFDMNDYHVVSSVDMINWVDHGVILKVADVPWADGNFWAPDCAYNKNDGKYYLYFPAHIRTQPTITDNHPEYWGIGVATSNSPSGPFVPVSYTNARSPDPSDPTIYNGQTYIPGSCSVDPCVFVDDDNQVYMFFGGKGAGGIPYNTPIVINGKTYNPRPRWVKLKPNMIEFDGMPQEIPAGVDNWYEASWVHKYNGKYYFSYCIGDHLGAAHQGEIHYSMSNSIAGPWSYQGCAIAQNEFATCWGSHQSFVDYKGQWYAFYQTVYGETRQRRGICVEKMNYKPDGTGTIQTVIPTRTGVGTSAYSRIKAQFCDLSGVDTEYFDTTENDIGKYLINIHASDFVSIDNLDFGSIGANGFEAQVASPKSGGTIEIWTGEDKGFHVVGTLTIPNTGDWHNWVTVSCDLYPNNIINGKQNIVLIFRGGSGGLCNLNWFKFKHVNPIPEGYSVTLKSLNPNCIDNKGSTGQKYLCNDNNNSNYICANRALIGPWEKFSVVAGNTSSLSLSGLIQFNSSNNGKNITYAGPDNSPVTANSVVAGNYNQPDLANSFIWDANFDGTISLKSSSNYHNKFFCVDTNYGANPAALYPNSREVANNWEKFYCEVGDAPLGCVVTFVSNNTIISGNRKYLCIDNNYSGDLCVNRAGVGGDWERFEVVDANHGYIALKSFNGNNYLRFENTDSPGKANGNITDSDNKTIFRWRNNGDGTVSLFNLGIGKYISADTAKGIDPVKVYADKDQVLDLIGDDTRFFCQVTTKPKLHFMTPVRNYSLTLSGTDVACQPKHYADWNTQSWIVETQSGNTVKIKNSLNNQYLTVINTNEGANVNVQNWNSDNRQKWVAEKNYQGFIRFRNVASGKYLTVYNPANNSGEYLSVVCQTLNTGWNSQQWVNE